MKRSNIIITSLFLCLLALSCAKTADEPSPTPSGSNLKIYVTLPSSSVGKTVWSKDDRVNFMVIKGENKLSELMVPKTFEGADATFEFSSFFPTDAQAYYAFIAGEGASGFSGSNSVKVAAVNSVSASATIPVTVGKADPSTKKMSMKPIYAQISFVTEKAGISHVIFQGNNSEIVSRANLVNLDDFSVKADPESTESGTTEIQVNVSGPGTYYVPLYPGINFSEGYTLTAYGTDGRVSMYAVSKDELVIETGKVYTALAFTDGPLPVGPFDPTKVVCSFGMLSDVHIDNNNNQNCHTKFTAALNQLQTQAGKDDSNGIDAICIAGDFTQTGYSSRSYNTSEIAKLKSLYEAVFDPVKVPMIYAVGNHDPYDQWNHSHTGKTSVYTEAMNIRTCFGDKYAKTDVEVSMRNSYECRHCIVGNYHILAVTPNNDNPVSYPSAVTQWLDKTLNDITTADPERYVILLTHPMIYDTAYGSLLGPGWLFGSCSDYWYTKGLTAVLEKYPQVMTFSGHLHFPINDPRSIWQGTFTAFGCGSTRYMAIEDGKYENMSSTTVMSDASEVSSGLLLQFDESGNARITKMFFSQNTTFDYPWDLARPMEDKSHLQTYSSANRKAVNAAPQLSSLSVTFAGSGSTKSVYAKFAAGTDDEFVHHYVVSVKKGSATLSTKRILADFYKHQWPSQMQQSYTQYMGDFETGDYTMVLEAYDSWDASASILTNFKVDAGAVTPSTPAALYADIDFSGGAAKDAKGKLTVTNHGASIGKVSVSHKGTSASVDAVSTSTGKNVECVFKDYTTSAAMREFLSGGFSVEAFFVDRKPGELIHGVVCGTEQGGWGIAIRPTAVPYFVVGDTSVNNYVYVDATSSISTSDLTHVVSVYDPQKKYVRIFVNGVLSSQQSIVGPYVPGAGDTFNRFYLGADVKPTGQTLDFQSVDMVLADVKFYTGVLDESGVSSAYQTAVNNLK